MAKRLATFRIARLRALAIRLEGLLREETMRDGAGTGPPRPVTRPIESNVIIGQSEAQPHRSSSSRPSSRLWRLAALAAAVYRHLHHRRRRRIQHPRLTRDAQCDALLADVEDDAMLGVDDRRRGGRCRLGKRYYFVRHAW
jgi:hypothetical protein